MSSLREQLDARLASTGLPQPFVLTTLEGLGVWIRRLSPREIREWWIFEYGKDGQSPLYDQLLVELFVRCCVDADGKPQFDKKDADKLRDLPGGGRALEEFYQEARRLNWLFTLDAKATAERQRFFSERALAALAGVASPPLTPANASSADSPSAAANPTSIASAT